MESRKQEEVAFHNQRELDRHALTEADYEKKYSNKKFYSVQRRSTAYFHAWLDEHCPGKVALDYCCGLGQTSLELAKRGARVHGIDISDESVKTSEELVRNAGFGANASFQVMDAEKMTFPDAMFDVIVCAGVLHHLDLKHAFPELARVLKPGGKIVCVEALGYNPAIRLYRKMTPHLRTAWEVDHILTMESLDGARAHFGRVDVRFFHLFTLAAIPLRKTPFFEPLLGLLELVDSVILRLPLIRLMAWQMVFTLSEPRKP